ncbi:dihydrofolate reductase family protein [Ktedonobacter robiniae]|uniref:dihydrofolate reductase family protein n=1 Tax=Ktedonobacter robiniae TaxID=2778365 RepID=UPI001F1B3BD4|nr:dihydrofolate reductase family protein [Ktedonobacter robiniae]
MRNLIEYTLVSLDGVFAGAAISGFSAYRDDTYMRDGLAQALACDALLMGRSTYEVFAATWPRRTDSWANRINAMPKYVFSSTLEKAEWANSTIVRGDVVDEVTRLKQQEGGNLLIYGHGLPERRCSSTICLTCSIFPFIRWLWGKGSSSSGRAKPPD